MTRLYAYFAAALSLGMSVAHADDGLGLKRGGNGQDVSISGVSHTSFDYFVPSGDTSERGTRVVCNPRGYSPRYLNPDFNPGLLIEV